jgi:hypothetical protein
MSMLSRHVIDVVAPDVPADDRSIGGRVGHRPEGRSDTALASDAMAGDDGGRGAGTLDGELAALALCSHEGLPSQLSSPHPTVSGMASKTTRMFLQVMLSGKRRSPRPTFFFGKLPVA